MLYGDSDMLWHIMARINDSQLHIGKRCLGAVVVHPDVTGLVAGQATVPAGQGQPGVRCKGQGARCLMPRARCQVYNARCKVHNARCRVSNARCQVPGV